MVTSRPRAFRRRKRALCLSLLVPLVVVGTEILVFDAGLEHVVGDGEQGFVAAAAGLEALVLCPGIGLALVGGRPGRLDLGGHANPAIEVRLKAGN